MSESVSEWVREGGERRKRRWHAAAFALVVASIHGHSLSTLSLKFWWGFDTFSHLFLSQFLSLNSLCPSLNNWRKKKKQQIMSPLRISIHCIFGSWKEQREKERERLKSWIRWLCGRISSVFFLVVVILFPLILSLHS